MEASDAELYARIPLLPRIWRYLWAGPDTLLGIAACLASLALPRRHGPVLLCRSDRAFARWFLVRRGYCAITLGHLVLVTVPVAPGLLRHEMAHVGQAERWGPLFLPAYLLSMVAARLQGKNPYWDNPFEAEARAQEAEVVAPFTAPDRMA